MKVNSTGDVKLNVEKCFGKEKTKTLVYMENSHGIVEQILLTKEQLKKLHDWIGHRLTELL